MKFKFVFDLDTSYDSKVLQVLFARIAFRFGKYVTHRKCYECGRFVQKDYMDIKATKWEYTCTMCHRYNAKDARSRGKTHSVSL